MSHTDDYRQRSLRPRVLVPKAARARPARALRDSYDARPKAS
jgi:hypothetical protein